MVADPSEPKDYVAGSSSLVMGSDSYSSPTELGDMEYVMGQNVTCRGGIVQTRPGSKSHYCMPDGNLQGFKVFIPDNGVAHHVFAVDGNIYVSAAPFTSYRRLWNLKFSKTAKYVAWAVCLKSTDYDNSGNLIVLDKPYSVLIIQDGLTRAGYWDGGNSGHLNPASAPFPDNTDIVPGYQETPIGLWMIWSGNRLWVSRGNQIFAGDIGNPLKFTETLYLNEGRAFNLSGPCNGMIEVPADAAGAKGFIAFTETDGTLFASYIQDRTTWLATPLFQNTILPQIGCVAPRSLVTQYGLNWWFGPRGFTNINSALRQNITSRIDYQDNEMFSSKAYLGPDLSGICASFYENYLLVSVPSCDVRNRHTWVLDQAPFENNAPAWPGFWTGWRPVEWSRGIINGSERIFFASVDYDGKNRVWEAMLSEKTDNGCRITCYAQLRDHAAGNLGQKKYDWSKFFLSQIYGEVDLNVYVASTKGAYQLLKNYHIVATEGQIFADTEYSESGPLMMGNRVQSRTIRTPSDPDASDCNACGVESKEGNMIDYAFTHLLAWSGQMGIKAYQMHMRESPERFDGDCEEPEVGPLALNAAGCSVRGLFVDSGPFQSFTGSADGVGATRNGGTAFVRRESRSVISQENADELAKCAVQKTIAYLQDKDVLTGVYGSGEAEIGSGTYLVVEAPFEEEPVVVVPYDVFARFRNNIPSGELFELATGINEFDILFQDGFYYLFHDDKTQTVIRKASTILGLQSAGAIIGTASGRYPAAIKVGSVWHLWTWDQPNNISKHYTGSFPQGPYTFSDSLPLNYADFAVTLFNDGIYYGCYKDLTSAPYRVGIMMANDPSGPWTDLGKTFPPTVPLWYAEEQADPSVFQIFGVRYILFAAFDGIFQRCALCILNEDMTVKHPPVVIRDPIASWEQNNGSPKVFNPVWLNSPELPNQDKIFYAQNPNAAVPAGWGYLAKGPAPQDGREFLDLTRLDFVTGYDVATGISYNFYGTASIVGQALVTTTMPGGLYGFTNLLDVSEFTIFVDAQPSTLIADYQLLIRLSTLNPVVNPIVAIWIDPTGHAYCEIHDTAGTHNLSLTGTTVMVNGSRYKIGLKLVGGTARLYVNGSIEASGAYSVPVIGLGEWSVANKKGKTASASQQFAGTIRQVFATEGDVPLPS